MATVYEVCLALEDAGSEVWFGLAELGLSEPERTRVVAGVDMLTLRGTGPTAFTDDQLFAYHALLRFRRVDNGTPRLLFLGRVEPYERVCEASETYTIEVRGIWGWLDETPMRQDWAVLEQTVTKPRVILFCDEAGARISTGQQIEQCVQAARAAGCPLAEPEPGDIAAGFTPPFDEQVVIMISHAICKALANHPHAVCWVDYSERLPRLRVATRQSLPAVSVSVAGKLGIRIKPREDQQPTAVAICYERESEADGQSYLESFIDYAPVIDGETTAETRARLAQAGVIWGVYDLQGGSRQTVTQDIEVAAIPVTMDGRIGFIKQHIPRLADFADIDIELESWSRSGDTELVNILLKGAIYGWMPVDWERQTVTAEVTLINRDGEDDVVERRKETLTLEFVATSAETRTYRTTAAFDPGEPAPEGIAAAMWEEWQQLHHDGVVSVAEDECSGSVEPGKVINLTGGRTEWTTMAAMIRRVTERFDAGVTEIEFGVPTWIDLDSRVAWYRTNRARSYAFSRYLRVELEEGDVGIADTSAKRDGGNVTDIHRRRFVGDNGADVDINPDEDLPEGEVAKFREISYVDSDGVPQTASVLATEPEAGTSGTVTEEDIDIYCKQFVLKAKLRTRTVGEGEEAEATLVDIKPVEKVAYSPSDRRLLLQITEPETDSFVLALDRGYLKQ